MDSNAFQRANPAAAVAIGVAGTGFLLVRAIELSFTHDEALTFLHAIRPGLVRLLSFGFPDANNHLLNSLLGWIAYRSLGASGLGASEWALRLPNVLAFPLLVAAAYRLLSRRVRPALVVPGLLLLVCNPFMLDFFALCRGYGLALALGVLALAAALSSLDDPSERPLALRRRDALKAGGFAAAATLANLAWLNFALALALVLFAAQWMRARREPGTGSFARSWLLPQLPTAVLSAAILAPVISRLRARQAFYLGGDSGFWQDTVGSLIESSLYAQPYAETLLAPVAFAVGALAIIAAGITLAGARHASPGSSREGALVLTGILLACIASSELQHLLFGTKFLIDRTALFVLPVFALLVSFACDALHAPAALRRVGAGTTAVLAATALAHTLLALNTTKTLEWAYDADVKRMLRDLDRIVHESGAPARVQRLGAEWLHQPAIDFYRERDGLDWLAPMTRRGIVRRREYDYYFYRLDDDTLHIPMQTLVRYPLSEHLLARDRAAVE
jgi:hypothetical protein